MDSVDKAKVTINAGSFAAITFYSIVRSSYFFLPGRYTYCAAVSNLAIHFYPLTPFFFSFETTAATLDFFPNIVVYHL